MSDNNTDGLDNFGESQPPVSGGFMKFYGLYWKKEYVYVGKKLLPGLPTGWIGGGRFKSDFDKNKFWINFWDQKGVYILYDDQLSPVYAGQAGLTRKGRNANESGGTLGTRLSNHIEGKYRNGWSHFSWFGFLDSEDVKSLRKKMKNSELEKRNNPKWDFLESSTSERTLNLLLDSFEAILIEAFTPRFNARGGNLKDAVYVNQFESVPS